MRPRVLRRRLALMVFGAILAGSAIGFAAAPDAHAYPGQCGLGAYEVAAWGGGFCDSPPVGAAGQHFHCQWYVGFNLCEWRWDDNTTAPTPRFVA